MTPEEKGFVAQSALFREAALGELGVVDVRALPDIEERPPRELQPILITNGSALEAHERESIREAYDSESGVAYFALRESQRREPGRHPLFGLVEQLRGVLRLDHPLPHPLEGHPDAVERFGPADGTVKIYDLPVDPGGARYREQAETSELFALHHDGLGSGGTVETVVLYADSGPTAGGHTFFQNIVRLGLHLSAIDPAAFEALFLPDALTITRPRGKGAICVRTPVLFLNEQLRPQSFYRVASGEYRVQWRTDVPALERAATFLGRFSEPFSAGQSFLHFAHEGQGCLIRNRVVAHGRTSFVDGDRRRCLSRKWYMRSERDEVYKHVPGMFIDDRFRALVPDLHGDELLVGEWRYDADNDQNRRLA